MFFGRRAMQQIEMCDRLGNSRGLVQGEIIHREPMGPVQGFYEIKYKTPDGGICTGYLQDEVEKTAGPA